MGNSWVNKLLTIAKQFNIVYTLQLYKNLARDYIGN